MPVTFSAALMPAQHDFAIEHTLLKAIDPTVTQLLAIIYHETTVEILLAALDSRSLDKRLEFFSPHAVARTHKLEEVNCGVRLISFLR